MMNTVVRCCLFLGIAVTIFTPPVLAAPPPVQAFFSYPQISEAQISPDGKYLAMVVADSETGENRKGLAVLSLDSQKITASFRTVGNQDIYR